MSMGFGLHFGCVAVNTAPVRQNKEAVLIDIDLSAVIRASKPTAADLAAFDVHDPLLDDLKKNFVLTHYAAATSSLNGTM